MPLWSFLVSRNWASSRLRTGLSLLGIALGTAIVVAIHVMDHNTVQSRLVEHRPDRGVVDLEVAPLQPQRDPAAVQQDLAGRPGVKAVARWREARAVAGAGDRHDGVAVFGLDPLPAGPFQHYAIAAGRDLTATAGEAEVLLGQEAAKVLQVGPGDRLQLSAPPQSQRVECRDGQLHVVPLGPDFVPYRCTVQVVGVLAYERLGRHEFGQVVVGSHALAQRFLQAGADVWQLQREYGADLDRLRNDLRADYRVENKRAAMIGEGADERAFRNGLKVLGCLALVVGMFVVFQTLSHSLVSRVRQIGLLRCLGVSSGGLLRIFLADALLLGGIGSGLGIGLGLLLALLLQHYRVSSLGVGKPWTSFEVPLGPVLGTTALGVLFTLAGALFPLLRVRSVSALQVLHSRGLSDRDGDGVDLLKGVNVWLFGLLVVALPAAYLAMTPIVSEEGRETLVVLAEMAGMLLGFGGVLLLAPALVSLLGRLLLLPGRLCAPLAGYLTHKVVQRSGGRMAAATCGLAAVLLAVLGLKTLTVSLQAEAWAFGAAALEHRLFLEGQEVTVEAAMQLQAIPGVVAVEPQEGLQLDGFPLGGLAQAAAAGRDGALEPYPDLARRYADERSRTLIASTRLARKMGWQPGSLVAMRDRNGAGVSYEVLLVSDRSGFQPNERAFAITSPYWMHKDFCVPAACVKSICVRLGPGADPVVVRDRCKQLLPGTEKRRTGEDLRNYLVFDIERDFWLFDVLLLLILGLAGLSLLNGMTIAALGRIREIGVLRALGIGRRTLAIAFVLEGAVTGLLAAGLSLLLAVPMAHVLVAGLNLVACLEAPVTLPLSWFVGTPLLALATGVLAAIVPGLRAAAQSPAQSVRYE